MSRLRRSSGLLFALTIAPALLIAPSALADPAVVQDPAVPTSAAPTPVLQGAKNFRDIASNTTTGNLTTADGRQIRPGLVFRSNKLSNLTAADLDTLTAKNVTLDIDMRNASERAEAPDMLPDGVEYRVADVVSIENGIGFGEFLPITLGRGLIGAGSSEFGSSGGSSGSADISWSAVGQHFGYPLMASFEGSDVAFRDLLLGIAGNDTGATVFHCSAGKDRTGWGAAILLTILGVPRDQVNADFMASNDYLGRSDAVQQSWLDSSFSTVEAIYGSFDNYVREGLGIDQATIDALKAKLLQ